MATVTKKNIKHLVNFGGVPYGNQTSYGPFNFTTDASGVFTDSDQATAVVQTDKLRLGILPAGMLLEDAIGYLSDDGTASATLKVGFEYVDGNDDADVPQDDDFFSASWDIGTAAAVLRKDNATPPVRLPKDAYLIATLAGADLDEATVLDIYVKGEVSGQP